MKQWQKIKVIEHCRESYGDINVFVQKWITYSSALYFKDNALQKWIKAIFQKILSERTPISQFLKMTFFWFGEFRNPSSDMTKWLNLGERSIVRSWVFNFPVPLYPDFSNTAIERTEKLFLKTFSLLWKNGTLRHPMAVKDVKQSQNKWHIWAN